MSTIYVFDQELSALGAVPAADDLLLIHDTSAGLKYDVTVGLIKEGARTVTAVTSAASLSGYGISVAPSSAAPLILADPTQAGQETTILFPHSTGARTVTRTAASILGSTITSTGATVITVAAASNGISGSVTLVASSTAQWYLKAIVGTITCT
jgi:hypothetical protein